MALAQVEPIRAEPVPDHGQILAYSLIVLYVLLLAGGFVLIRYGRVLPAGSEMSLRRCIFTTVNAGTLTGFQQSVGLDRLAGDHPAAGLTLLALTLAGAFVSLAVGGLAGARVLGLPYTDRQVLTASFFCLTLAPLAGAAALIGTDRGTWDSLFQAASAFSNSGLYIGHLGTPGDARVHLVLLPLAIVGGLGLPVLMQLYDRITGGPRLSNHSRSVLVLTAAVYLAGTLLMILAQWPDRQPDGTLDTAAWREAVASGSAAAMNSRTAGFPLAYTAALPRAMQWLIVGLMIIGASSGGAGGGVKTTTLLRLGRGAADALRSRTPPRGFGIAAVWLTVYLLTALGGFLLLLASEADMPTDRLLFLAFSATSNVGLSHDPISMSGKGLYTLSAMMLLGRLVPLLILCWMSRSAKGEDLLVG